MVVNARSLKRMKRRVTADLHDLLTFPAEASSLSAASFRTSVREFLARHALLPPPYSLIPHLMTWQILFRVGDRTTADGSPVVVAVDVVEEDVARSRSVYCDHCRVVGWSGHPVCTKRYHVIVKGDGTSIGGQIKPCTRCGVHVHLSEPRCKSCNHVMTSEELEDWMYQQLEDTTHLLHGVVHENGYGHLLRINGIEGGSKLLSGVRIMDFWDRLCKYLGVRKISVMDVSKKYGLEYRMLHAITNGRPWYGDWGYEFGAGSFGLTLETYQEAVKTLSSLPLSTFICQGRKPRSRVQELILFYQSQAENELVTVRDLFSYLASRAQNAPRVSAAPVGGSFKKRKPSPPEEVLSNWSSSDVNRVEDAMIRVLMAVTWSKWVNWRTLRSAVSKAGPPDLLDHCLKNLKGKLVGNGIFVNARSSPQSSALEYRLESGVPCANGDVASVDTFLSSPSKDRIVNDLKFLYESLLQPLTMLSFGPYPKRDLLVQAATIVLDCKQFLKDYNPEVKLAITDSTSIFLFCQPELTDQFEEDDITPPPELIVLPQNATITDLKQEASKVFQEVYIMFKGFQGEELLDFNRLDDSTPVKILLRSFETVTVKGRCVVKNGLSMFRMERGVENWTVDCSCGAEDDDGERMLACDGCGVWQHTRCAGIHDSDAVPARFVCDRCRSLYMEAKMCSSNDITRPRVGGGCGGKSLPRMPANFCA